MEPTTATTELPSVTMTAHSLTPQTSARLATLEAEIAHLGTLDGPAAKAYLRAMSEEMGCGPYEQSEVTALSNVQRLLAELDAEKAALRLGLFDEYTEQLGRAEEMLERMREAAERDGEEIGRLKRELGVVREELMMGSGRGDKEKGERRQGMRDGDGETNQPEGLQEGLERMAIADRDGLSS